MNEVLTSTLVRKLVVLALLVAGSFWFSRGAIGRLITGQSSNLQQSPSVILTPQQGAPLQILSTWIATQTPQNFRLMAQVQNQSGKAIRAYAVISQTATEKQQNGKSQFFNLTDRSSFWEPAEIRTIEVGDSQDEPVKSVRLTLDFVEFADGSIWGPDTSNSRDMLAGQREGARFIRQQLRQLLQSKGEESLKADLQRNEAADQSIDASIAANHSSQWVEGFRNGAASARRRLRSALASGNKQTLRTELDRPFDTYEEEHK